jgi:hypothetical protein
MHILLSFLVCAFGEQRRSIQPVRPSVRGAKPG